MPELVETYWVFVKPDGETVGPMWASVEWADKIGPNFPMEVMEGAKLYRYQTTREPVPGHSLKFREPTVMKFRDPNEYDFEP